SAPAITLPSPPSVIGMEGSVRARVESPHGVRHLTAYLAQDGARYLIYDRPQPATRFLFWTHRQPPLEVTMPAGKKLAPALKDGKAKLIMEAHPNDLRAGSTSKEVDVEIISAPPRLAVDGFQHYINQGGCELAVATVTGYWTDAGVRTGPNSFRSFPL